MAERAVTLIGGPTDGIVVFVDDPWPRYGYFSAKPDGHLRTYDMRPGGPPYIADWVNPDTIGDDNVEQVTEGEPGPAGTAGPAGPPGPQGQRGPAGKGIDYRGGWDAGTTYSLNDVVRYGGSSWISKTDMNLGNEPTSSANPNWGLVAEQGDTGAQGPQGDTGATGAAGATGPEGPQGDPGDDGVIAAVQWAGVDLTPRSRLNFTGTGVADVSDDAGNDRTTVEIAGSGGGGGLDPLFSDDFTAPGLSDWTIGQGGAFFSVTGGVLRFVAGGDARLWRTGIAVADYRAMEKALYRDSPDAMTDLGLMGKVIDNANFLLALTHANAVHIFKCDGGTFTLLANTAISGLVANRWYWQVLAQDRNDVRVEFWKYNPAYSQSKGPAVIVEHTLSGGDIAKYGEGVAGSVGLRQGGANVDVDITGAVDLADLPLAALGP